MCITNFKGDKNMYITEDFLAVPDGLGQVGSGKIGMRKQAQAEESIFRNGKDKKRWTSADEGKLGRKISKAKNDGRKNNIKLQKPEELESFVLTEPAKKNEKKYSSQSTIGMPNRRIVREVNKELSKKYGLDK